MSQRDGVVNMREVPKETWQEGRFSRREQDLGRAAGSASEARCFLPASSPCRATPTWPRRRSSLRCGAAGHSSIPSPPNKSALKLCSREVAQGWCEGRRVVMRSTTTSGVCAGRTYARCWDAHIPARCLFYFGL